MPMTIWFDWMCLSGFCKIRHSHICLAVGTLMWRNINERWQWPGSPGFLTPGAWWASAWGWASSALLRLSTIVPGWGLYLITIQAQQVNSACSFWDQSLKSIFLQWSRYIGSSTWSSNILFSDDGTSLRAWTRKPWSWGGGHGSAAVSKGASFLSFKLFHAPCLPWWLLLPRWFHFFEGYGREEYDCM